MMEKSKQEQLYKATIPTAVPLEKTRRVVETLAYWLPGGEDGHALAAWDEDDWFAALWATYWQNALPWFVQRLQQTAVSPPPEIGAILTAVDQDSRQRTHQMLNNAVELLGCLRQANIAALPLKGAVLAARYFDDPYLRPLADVDILVTRQDIPAAVAIMSQLEYHHIKSNHKEEVFIRGQRQKHPWSADNVHAVEIQHKALNEYVCLAYDTAKLWQATTEAVLWNDAVFTMPTKAALFDHVCAHASRDWLMHRGKLMQLKDIETLAQKMKSADWDAFLSNMRGYDARFVYPAIAFARQYAGASIPESVMHRLQQLTPVPLQNWVQTTQLAQIFRLQIHNNPWLEYDLANMLVRSPGEKRRVLLRMVFPPRWNERLLAAYPKLMESPFWPLAYLLFNGKRLQKLMWTQFRLGV